MTNIKDKPDPNVDLATLARLREPHERARVTQAIQKFMPEVLKVVDPHVDHFKAAGDFGPNGEITLKLWRDLGFDEFTPKALGFLKGLGMGLPTDPEIRGNTITFAHVNELLAAMNKVLPFKDQIPLVNGDRSVQMI